MPYSSYIHTHELWGAWEALGLGHAGIAELKTFAHYDVDATEDDAEERIIEIIEDECASEAASNAYKIEREAA